MKDESALSSVVLPEPVPPQTSRLQRRRTARASSSASGAVSVPLATRSSGVKPRRRKRRIVSTGPSSASGGITTFTREPSGRRASHSGSASSTRRPSGARMRSIAWRSSPVAGEADVGGLEPSAPLDPGGRRPAHQHLVDLGVRQQRLERAEPERALGDAGDERGARTLVEHRRLAVDERADPLLRVLGRAGVDGPREHPLAEGAGEPVERGAPRRTPASGASRRAPTPAARTGSRAAPGTTTRRRAPRGRCRTLRSARGRPCGASRGCASRRARATGAAAQAGARDVAAAHAAADDGQATAATDADAHRRADRQPQRHRRAAVDEPDLPRRADPRERGQAAVAARPDAGDRAPGAARPSARASAPGCGRAGGRSGRSGGRGCARASAT